MARFTLAKDIEAKVARIATPEVDKTVREVEREAKHLAPPTKEWVHMGDGRVRRQHRQAGGQVVPDNLRFKLTSYRWDVEHPGAMGPLRRGTPGGDGWAGQDAPMVPGHHTYLRWPRDESAGAYVSVVNCFPGDTLVSAAQVRKAFRRWYDGPVVRVETQRGRILTGTPNHEVLTNRGWVALGSLNESDRLVCTSGSGDSPPGAVVHGDPDVEHLPARVDEVAGALAVVGSTERVHGRAMDFHGDGGETEVDVVRANGDLHVGVVPSFGQQAGQIDLPDAEMAEEIALSGLRPPDGRLPAVQRLAPPLMRIGGKALRLCRAVGPVALVHGLRAVAGGRSGTGQPPPDCLPGGPVRDCQGFHGFPGPMATSDFFDREVDDFSAPAPHRFSHFDASLVQPVVDAGCAGALRGGDVRNAVSGSVTLDAVVRVHDRSYVGWVFNLETASNWYVANGIIAHNCRCVVRVDPDGVAKLISSERPKLYGRGVLGKVVAEGDLVVEAEYGTVYPGGLDAEGAYYMTRAARQVAARRRARR